MAAEALALDAPEHVSEIDVAVPRREVHLMPVAEAIGESHLLDQCHIERTDKPGYALRHEVRMVGSERQPERRRADLLEIETPFLDRMGEVVHFGVFRFLVQVLQKHQSAALLGVIDDALQPFASGAHPLFTVRGEVKAGMQDDPLRTEPYRGIDIGSHIGVDRFADIGRIFRDVDRRRSVQPEMNAGAFAGGTQRGGARPVDRAERVVPGIELHVDVADFVRRGPGDRVFQFQFAADIDADPVTQRGHGAPPLSRNARCSGGCNSPNRSRCHG